MKKIFSGASVLATFATLALASPAMAADKAPPEWVGVFEGTVGKYPVIACFGENYRGSYYYLSQLKPIKLEGSEASVEWTERVAYDRGDKGSAASVWDIKWTGANNINGTWNSGAKKLPVKLARKNGKEDQDSRACGTENFMSARLTKPEFSQSAANLGSFNYTIINYESPKHFSDVGISSFTFKPTQPGDSMIIKQLSSILPKGNMEDEYVGCMAATITSMGWDGDYNEGVSPEFVNSQFLTVNYFINVSCGGAHPNEGMGYTTYDRQTGKELDPVKWFNERAIEKGTAITPVLQAAIMRKRDMDKVNDAECRSAVEGEQYWSYQLLGNGISFTPDLPRVNQACADATFFSWDEVEPFLSSEGKSIRVRVQQK